VGFPRSPSILRVNPTPPFCSPDAARDPLLIQIEKHIRQAIRDAVNQGSRKPFLWGGLRGYEQLQILAQELDLVEARDPESDYWRLLRGRVGRVLAKNRTVAEDLEQAHQILLQIAKCLRYPPEAQGVPGGAKPDSQQIAREMETLIQTTHPSGKIQRAQIRLLGALKRRWKLYGAELLYGYDIPGLPQDNLRLESLFGRLHRHQRRISGRKSTRELLDFGQAQVLFTATSSQELLSQIQGVSREAYWVHRNRLAAAELPRQFLYRLHRNPRKTIRALLDYHSKRSLATQNHEATVFFIQALHTG
jgi:hypothetical protein